VIFGSPAKVAREATPDNSARSKGDTLSDVHRGAHYKANLKRIG
jgi:hypothetical protein